MDAAPMSASSPAPAAAAPPKLELPASWAGAAGDAFAAVALTGVDAVDAQFDALYGRSLTVILQEALEALEIDLRTARVLEVGCGCGNALAVLRSLGFPEASLHGVDLSEAALAKCREQLPGASVQLVPEGDAFGFTCEGAEEGFDLVLVCSTLPYIPPAELPALLGRLRSLRCERLLAVEEVSSGGYRRHKRPDSAWELHCNNWETLVPAKDDLAVGERLYRQELPYAEGKRAECRPMTHGLAVAWAIEPPLGAEAVAALLAEAADLKTFGNDSFKAQRFDDAAEAYSDAIAETDAGRGVAEVLAVRCVLHNNRAQARLKLLDFTGAAEDASYVLGVDGANVKALKRRVAADELLLDGEEALEKRIALVSQIVDDTKALLALTKGDAESQRRLGPRERELGELRERQKEEMLGTLKDFGNKILGKFGLSTDNFNMVQQPGGGYSMNFDQGK